MAAPKGNKFYELRSKDGRDKLFDDPEVLKNEIVKYFQKVEGRTLAKSELIRSGENAGMQVELLIGDFPTKPELANDLGFAKWESLTNYKEYSNDFLEVITWAESQIANWKLKEAAIGNLNANIIARDLGLAEKTEVKQEGNYKFDLSEMTYEEKQMLFELSMKVKDGN